MNALEKMDEAQKGEFWASLAFRRTEGLGARSHKKLLNFFGSAHEAFKNINRWAEAGISEEKIVAARSEAWRKAALPEWKAAQKFSGRVILWTSPEYPLLLRELPDPPVILYAVGDVNLLKNPAVAVVGARDCTAEGLLTVGDIAARLASNGITIVSGMAHGIDRQAHLVSVSKPGGSIAVLGCGPDIIYPMQNRDIYQQLVQHGLILSEYTPGTRPEAHNFPVRNRIISGLALGVLVVEATMRSGSLITAKAALEQNREVYAVPGPTYSDYSRGCQELVRQGARAIFSAEDIMADLAPLLAGYKQYSAPGNAGAIEDGELKDPLVGLEGDNARIAALLKEKGPRNADQICAELSLSPAEVQSLLVEMEMDGILARLPGLRFSLNK